MFPSDPSNPEVNPLFNVNGAICSKPWLTVKECQECEDGRGHYNEDYYQSSYYGGYDYNYEYRAPDYGFDTNRLIIYQWTSMYKMYFRPKRSIVDLVRRLQRSMCQCSDDKSRYFDFKGTVQHITVR